MAQSKCSQEAVPTSVIILIEGNSNPRGTSEATEPSLYELVSQGGWKGILSTGTEPAKCCILVTINLPQRTLPRTRHSVGAH